MLPGVVVRIRVNPTTCISVLDTLHAVGIKTDKMSFATCVSTALNVLVETAKGSGVLPEPDPYEFNERMKYHHGEEAPDRRKLPKSKVGVLNPQIFAEYTPDLGTPKWLKGKPTAPVKPAVEWIDPAIPTNPEKLVEYKEAIKRLTTAQQKKDLAEQGTEGVLWSDRDESDFQRDIKIVYG